MTYQEVPMDPIHIYVLHKHGETNSIHQDNLKKILWLHKVKIIWNKFLTVSKNIIRLTCQLNPVYIHCCNRFQKHDIVQKRCKLKLD